MRTVLVTGAAGFVGANLVRLLLDETDAHVVALDALTYAGRRDNLPESGRLTFVEGDVCDAALVDRLVADCDTVVHLAAESHNDRGIAAPEAFVRTNVHGTYVVLEAVRAHGARLHHVSTDEVHGSLDLGSAERFTAASPYDPRSPYAASKAAADHLVRAWTHTYGIAATTSGCSNNYGPYQHVEKLVPRQVTTLLDGGRPVLFGDGLHVRDWIHVEDHCRALLAILERGRPGATYLVGADGEASNIDVVRTLMDVLGIDEQVRFVRDRPGHDRRYAIDPRPFMDELGWRPVHTDLAAGLAETVRWYAEHEGWWRPVKTGTEAMYERLGR